MKIVMYRETLPKKHGNTAITLSPCCVTPNFPLTHIKAIGNDRCVGYYPNIA